MRFVCCVRGAEVNALTYSQEEERFVEKSIRERQKGEDAGGAAEENGTSLRRIAAMSGRTLEGPTKLGQAG
jgi:hypothetical protein